MKSTVHRDASELRALPDVQPAKVLAWDLPTRLFKWALVALVLTAWIASGSKDPTMTVHKLAGTGVLILVVYRILWGFFGGTTARFATFLRSPREAIRYLAALREHRARRYLGHNPAGGWMILALLGACGIQALLGLVSTDGVLASGPLADLAGDRVATIAASIHAVWFYVLLALAAVHIAMNLFYVLIKRDNLIGAMVTGRKTAGFYADARASRAGSIIAALLCLGIAATSVLLVISLAGGTLLAGG